MHDQTPASAGTTIPPLSDRLRAAIAALGENYSKSMMQTVLGLLREVLPIVEGQRIPADLAASMESILDGCSELVNRSPTPASVSLRHAQVVAECLWHTLNQIAMLQSSDYEHSDPGELAGYRKRVRQLAERRHMLIADLPADETISNGAWCAAPSPTILDERRELLADVAARARRVAAAHDMVGKLTKAEALREFAVQMEEIAKIPVCTGDVELGNKQQVLPPGLLTCATAAACALEETLKGMPEEMLGEGKPAGIVATAARVLREIIEVADVHPEIVDTRFKDVFWLDGARTGLRFEGFPDIAVPDEDARALQHQYLTRSFAPPVLTFEDLQKVQVGKLPAMAAPGRLFLVASPPRDRMNQRVSITAYYLDGGRLWVVDRGHLDLHTLFLSQQDIRLEVHLQQPETPSTVSWTTSGPKAEPSPPGMMPRVGPRAPRDYMVPPSTRSVIRGEGGGGEVHVTTNAAGEIEQVTCHDIGNEDEFEDEANVGPADPEDSLADRCETMADIILTLLGPLGDENPVPEPLRSGVVTAAQLLSEVAADLRERDKEWWILEDISAGTDHDATLYAIPRDGLPGLDDAIGTWASSLERIYADAEHRDPHPVPFDLQIGTMVFRPERCAAGLGDLPGTLYFVQPEGSMKLMEAIELLAEGESLYIDDGSITTTYADDDDREPRNVFRLLDFCDKADYPTAEERRQVAAEQDRREDELDTFEQATAEQIAARDAANLNDHEAFARETDPPASVRGLAEAYVARGWMLHEDANGLVHLLDAELGTTAADHGEGPKGRAVEPADVLDENLCALCCAAANDRAAQV